MDRSTAVSNGSCTPASHLTYISLIPTAQGHHHTKNENLTSIDSSYSEIIRNEGAWISHLYRLSQILNAAFRNMYFNSLWQFFLHTNETFQSTVVAAGSAPMHILQLISWATEENIHSLHMQ